MKGSRCFIVFVVAFLMLMFAVEYHLPKNFVWTPTFSHYDAQPFGCAVFDSLLSSSLPSGYALSKETFYRLEREDTTHCRGILVVAKDLTLSDVDVKSLLKMAERGNKIMLVSTLFGKYLEDTLKFNCYSSYFSPMTLKKDLTSLLKKDTLCWVGDSTVYSPQAYSFYPPFCASYFWGDSLQGRVLSQKCMDVNQLEYQTNRSDSLYSDSICCTPVAMTYSWGKGEIILVSTPLLFTNYGVLDGRSVHYLFRLLSQMKGLPIVRIEGYTKETAQVQQSPFRYFLSQRPLRWALYLTMITIMLFMLFTARRRQRAIPVIREPENKSLEFTELIGTLYYQKKDHADLVRKKFTYFAEVLRREIQVDIEVVADDEQTFRRIARKTGLEVEEISRFISEVRPVIYGGRTIDDVEMKRMIDKINEIINDI